MDQALLPLSTDPHEVGVADLDPQMQLAWLGAHSVPSWLSIFVAVLQRPLTILLYGR